MNTLRNHQKRRIMNNRHRDARMGAHLAAVSKKDD